MKFYCGLVVHITDTRAQKVVSYTSAHITETVFAHDQHWEEQSCLSSPQLYRHSQKHRKWIDHTVRHYTTGVNTCPALRGARHFPSTSCFLCLVFTQCPHIIATQKYNGNCLVVRLNNAAFSYIRSSYVSSIIDVARTVFTKAKFV